MDVSLPNSIALSVHVASSGVAHLGRSLGGLGRFPVGDGGGLTWVVCRYDLCRRWIPLRILIQMQI